MPPVLGGFLVLEDSRLTAYCCVQESFSEVDVELPLVASLALVPRVKNGLMDHASLI
jgi:hypothetical protein